MKLKRIFTAILVIALCAGMLLSVSAVDTLPKASATGGTDGVNFGNANTKLGNQWVCIEYKTNNFLFFKTLEDCLTGLSEGFTTDNARMSAFVKNPDTTKGEKNLEEEFPKTKEVVVELRCDACDYNISTALNVDRVLTIHHSFQNTATKIKFEGAITVQNDAVLTIEPGKGTQSSTIPEITFAQPVTVDNGGSFVLRGSNANGANPYSAKYTGTTGSFLTVAEGGTATILSYSIESSSSAPVIVANGNVEIPLTEVSQWPCEIQAPGTIMQVSETGSAKIGGGVFTTTSDTGAAFTIAEGGTLEISGTQLEVYGGEVVAPTIEATGSSPAIEVSTGATLTLNDGEIKTTAKDVPAITVADGAKLVIPADSKVEVTASDNDTKAIDLAGGATVEKSGIVTVIVSDENAAAGDNYVDNYGVIHLAAGAKAGTDDDPASGNDPMNAAVVLPDGTIVQGNGSTAPTVETKEVDGKTVITVDVPAGGSVQEPGKEPVNMPFGGTVDGGVVNADKPSVIPPIAGTIINGLGSMVQSPFVDVTTMDYYYDAVNWAVENDITTGTGRYTFSPDEPCTRAQAVTFLWRAAGSPTPKNAVTAFVDVDSTAYYAKAVAWAVENGVTNGTSDTTFSPSAPCTRAQIVSFLYRAFGSTTDAAVPFTDVALDAYYAPAVAWAAANNVTGGTTTSTFSPAATCTRAQIVTFLYRCR